MFISEIGYGVQKRYPMNQKNAFALMIIKSITDNLKICTSMLALLSPSTGSIRANTSSLLEPAYARPNLQ